MTTTLLAEGYNLEELANIQIPAGKQVELRFYTLKAPTVEALNKLQAALVENGINLTAPVEATVETPSIWKVRMKAADASRQIGFFPFIPVALAVGILGVFGFMGWGLYETLKKNIVPIILAGAGIYFLWKYVLPSEVKEPARSAAKKAIKKALE